VTLADLIAEFRSAADDADAQPYLFSDADITRWLNEAQTEAAIRRRLLRETTDPAMCEIDVTAGTADYTLHPDFVELSHHAFLLDGATERTDLLLVTREWLDRNVARWRDMESDEPLYLVQDALNLRLVPTPSADGTLLLEGYRVPSAQMALSADTPEIAAIHHRHLVQWALYRGYGVPDKEVFDPKRAAQAEADFTRYFGPRPDADLRNDTRMDTPQHIQAWI
jgi:hypothetical protein